MTRTTAQSRKAPCGAVYCRADGAAAWVNRGESPAMRANARHYQRHRPEQTLLYRIVEDNDPALVTQMAREGRPLPYYEKREFDAFLRCGRLEHGFFRVRCDDCHAVD